MRQSSSMLTCLVQLPAPGCTFQSTEVKSVKVQRSSSFCHLAFIQDCCIVGSEHSKRGASSQQQLMPSVLWHISGTFLISLAKTILQRRASLAGAVQAAVLGYSTVQLMQAFPLHHGALLLCEWHDLTHAFDSLRPVPIHGYARVYIVMFSAFRLQSSQKRTSFTCLASITWVADASGHIP